ncbi:MAG TPA: UPF0158 family protein [Phycisphaerae bacterium]|nr:UPF0158 family protein [Phycisphaerae bacterium]
MKLDDFVQAMQSQPGFGSSFEGGAYYDRQTNTIAESTRGGDGCVDDLDDDADLEDWQKEELEQNRLIEDDEAANLETPSKRRFVLLPDSFEIHEWRMMEDFSISLDNDDHAAQLSEAIHGSGAFGRFKSAVHRLGLADQWYAYRDARYREIALEFCKENNIPLEET